MHSEWWKLVPVVLLWFILSPQMVLDKAEHEDWEYMVMYVNHEDMKCQNEIIGFEFDVRVRDLETALAQWHPKNNTMVFDPDWVDIDTIAHESHHATETIAKKLGVYDDKEKPAYMNGAIVNCVYQLINYHI